MAKSRIWTIAIWIAAIVLLNYISVNVATVLKIPFFLDTWGTSLGVMAAGLGVGMIGGVLYNLLTAFTLWGANQWVWAFVNIWVALAAFYFWRKGWIDIRKPGKLVLTGFIIGITEAVVILIILFGALGGIETYEGVLPTYEALLESSGNKLVAASGEKFITSVADQIVSLFIASIVYSSLPKKYKLKKDVRKGI